MADDGVREIKPVVFFNDPNKTSKDVKDFSPKVEKLDPSPEAAGEGAVPVVTVQDLIPPHDEVPAPTTPPPLDDLQPPTDEELLLQEEMEKEALRAGEASAT